MQKKKLLHELVMILNDVDGQYQVTGAHTRNLITVLNDDGSVFSSKMGDLVSIDLTNPVELETALGTVNAAVVNELNATKTLLNESNEAGRLLQDEHNKLIAEHAEQGQQLLQALATADGQRIELEKFSGELDALRAAEVALLAENQALDQQIQQLQAQLAAATQQPA